MRGVTHRSMTVAGLNRTYIIYLPTSFDPTTPIPFVFVFHGFAMGGQDMYTITQYAALADSEGIGLAFPDGETGPDSLGDPWNVKNPGQTVCGGGNLVSATGNDFAFIDAMKADVALDQCLDTAHIYSTAQYIPLSVVDLQLWMGSPSIYVYDCSNAGHIINFVKANPVSLSSSPHRRRPLPPGPVEQPLTPMGRSGAM